MQINPAITTHLGVNHVTTAQRSTVKIFPNPIRISKPIYPLRVLGRKIPPGRSIKCQFRIWKISIRKQIKGHQDHNDSSRVAPSLLSCSSQSLPGLYTYVFLHPREPISQVAQIEDIAGLLAFLLSSVSRCAFSPGARSLGARFFRPCAGRAPEAAVRLRFWLLTSVRVMPRLVSWFRNPGMVSFFVNLGRFCLEIIFITLI